ncbi:DUF5131 family protein [Terriglobus sp.]|uniref:DUF5131 family protein n=1 Tax=Terriglobus sp. TaxID=1889013 RepID=UPI003B006CF7
MSIGSTIEWTDATWNPVRGCTKISAGCKNCYAERFSERFRGVPGHPFEQGFEIRVVREKLQEPLKWRRPLRVFVNSMSDLFHDQIADSYIREVCDTMLAAHWHTFQVLTKRGERLEELLQSKLRDAADAKHIWWGVSVENKRDGLPRIEHLRRASPAVSFLSIEPLLEDLGEVDLTGVNWVIVGGESGPRSRPMEKKWVASLRDQCESVSVPFFFKQWGGTRKHRTGRKLDGNTYDAFPVLQ